MRKTVVLLIAILVFLVIFGFLLSALMSRGEAGESLPAATSVSTTAEAVPSQSATVPSEETEAPQTEAPQPPEITPDVVSIYIPADDGTKARVRITEFTARRTAKTDIDCFEVFASGEDRVEGSSFRAMWTQTWEAHDAPETAKIGFHIRFETSDGQVISKVILKPSDAAEFYGFLEVYLYDDVNQTPGVFYSHLEDGQMTDSTVITSIKLTSGSRIAEVGDIELTAFIYTGDECFDADGSYIGTVLSTVVIRDVE